MFIAIFMMENHAERKAQSEPSADPEGGGIGGPDPPPLENHKLYGFL